jgi:glutamyl-Q tRNA(Asp) synthetase
MAKALELFPGESRGPDGPPRWTRCRASLWVGWAPAFAGEPLAVAGGRDGNPCQPAQFGDVVLARKDAPVSYHLAVTVDDAAQGITDVVRGEDLFAGHARPPPAPGAARPADARYHHHRLVTDEAGRRLAKRHGAPTLADLRAGGADPRELAEKLRSGGLPAGYSAPAT